MTHTAPSISKIATIIGSDKGGVGKSLISSLLIEAYDQAARQLTVVEIDHQGKLRSQMGQRVDLSLAAGAELRDVTRDRHRAERFYNPVYEMWQRSDSLTDLGANVTTFIFNWMQQCFIREMAAEDAIHFRFVAVASPDDQALRSAYFAVAQAVQALGRDAELFVVLNETTPGTGFVHYENHQVMQDLRRLSETINLTTIHIPHCDSELMEYGRSRSMSPLAVFKNSEHLADGMGLGRIAGNTEKRRMLHWMTEVQEELRPLFAGAVRRAEPPQPAEPAVRQDHPRQDHPRQDHQRHDPRPELRSVPSPQVRPLTADRAVAR